MNQRWSVRLRDVADIDRRGINPSQIAEGTTYVGLEHIAPTGDALSSATVQAGELGSTKFQFTTEHILYGKLRPYLAKIVAPDFAGVCSTDILPIRPGPRIDKRFLLHFLRLPENVAWASSRATGVNLPRLSPAELADLAVPLPPLDEQRRVAAILDKADALRQKRKRTAALLDSLTQSIFLEMFGGGKQWPEASLAEVVTSGTIVTYGIVQAGEEFEGGIPYIRTGDIQNGRIRIDGLRHTDPAIAAKFERSRVRANEIVMSIRATVGTVALVPTELDSANLTQGTARISPGPRTVPLYLLHYLRSDPVQAWIKRQVKGATFLEITLGRLRELVVRLPPLAVQEHFASIVVEIERNIEKAVLANDAMDVLFASLQHRAFSGQL